MAMTGRWADCGGGGARRFSAVSTTDALSTPSRSANCFFRRLAQRFETRASLRLDLDGEADMAIANLDARHHAQADDVAAALRILHLAQRRENPFLE